MVRNPAQRMADVLVELLINLDPDTGERAKASTQVIIVAEQGVVDGTNPPGVMSRSSEQVPYHARSSEPCHRTWSWPA